MVLKSQIRNPNSQIDSESQINCFIVIVAFLIILFSSQISFAQRILFQSDFENINLTSDSLPAGWKKLDADSNFFGLGKSWAVRDTNQILGGDTIVNRPRANSGKRSLHISWFSGKGGSYVSDDWVWTDSLRIQNGDSLIFWSLLGNIEGISFYVDSVQVWVCSSQNPEDTLTKLSTIKSNLDTIENAWTEHKFMLEQFVNQRIYVAFRYYLPVENALWANIDDMFIGNRSATIGINPNNLNIPSTIVLHQNYPNPFNPETKINYELRITSFISIRVYDVLGNEVVSLVNEKQNPGNYSAEWNADNYSSGIYFYKLVAGDFSDTKRMILLK